MSDENKWDEHNGYWVGKDNDGWTVYGPDDIAVQDGHFPLDEFWFAMIMCNHLGQGEIPCRCSQKPEARAVFNEWKKKEATHA